ncbi:hypothetical protein GEOBRER4_n0326 [Citrifermentans bremense]|uniref:Uncharacterized protein n=1 Tax=Citrifermentans bremense TaxID=60035 RepID=A0A7R7FSC0_9BACT|nr:hypothetical protein GEOBRER4_n0326 [Citrifermentans bremense]
MECASEARGLSLALRGFCGYYLTLAGLHVRPFLSNKF